MATSLKTTTRNKATDAITTDAGATAYLWVWSGSAPAKSSNNFVAPTGTLGALFALPNPIAPGSSVGVLTFSTVTSVTGLAAITPGYVRITNRGPLTLTQATLSSGTVTYTGTITGGGSGALNGGVVNISGFTNAGNNGTFTILASTTTTFTAVNASGVNETHAGTAVVDFEAGDTIVQNSAGVGSGDYNFTSAITVGGTINVTSIVYTEGNP